ncbi:hypothetical protein AB0A69_07780 [Streptomyces sp. NPDC045431]|uniref:hypothetical protein n=1 Tax=Streptomyces sp. NPDC045431 TaxID=3155613 RepID=UPI0033CD4040
MTKVYPNAIRNFPTHKDGRDFVLAADVNEIQDELTGVETVLGTKPQIYTNAAGKKSEYKDVVTRLDAMQRYDDEVAETVNALVDASQTGWNLPVGTVRSTGSTIRPTVHNLSIQESDWQPVLWNRRITDMPHPVRIFPWHTSPTITCPKTGWWIITMRVLSSIPSGPTSLDHMCFARMYLSDHDTDVATGASTNPRGTRGWHRADLTYAGEWFAGERLQLQIRHMDSMKVNNRAKHPNPVGNITSYAWCGLTYIRALPNAFTSRPIEDVDPALPA